MDLSTLTARFIPTAQLIRMAPFTLMVRPRFRNGPSKIANIPSPFIRTQNRPHRLPLQPSIPQSIPQSTPISRLDGSVYSGHPIDSVNSLLACCSSPDAGRSRRTPKRLQFLRRSPLCRKIRPERIRLEIAQLNLGGAP